MTRHDDTAMPSRRGRRATVFGLGVILGALGVPAPSAEPPVTTGEAVTAERKDVQGEDALTSEQARALVDRLRPVVEEIRGLRFKQDVPVSVIDDDEARRYMLGRLAQFQSAEDLRHEQRAMVLLGVLPAGIDLLDAYLGFLREQAGGFYDPTTKSFYLLDDMPGAFTAALAVPHELTHALDDQHYDLDRLLRDSLPNDDLMFARASVHEGSATLLMQIYLMRAMAEGRFTADDLAQVAESQEVWAAQLEEFPAPLLRPLLGSYLLGASFLLRGNLLLLAGGFPSESVDRSYEDGPLSSEQILHPEKFWDPELRDDPTEVDLGAAGRALGRRWERRADGVLGELALGVMVGAPTPTDAANPMAMQGSAWTNEAAAGWDGDRWELWGRGEAVAALLGTVWDSERDAIEFVEALAGRDELAVRRCGERVAVVAGASERRAARAIGAVLSALGCTAKTR